MIARFMFFYKPGVTTLQQNLHDTSTIGDEKGNTSSTIAARGCSHGRAYDHKNKALPGDSPDYHIYFPSIKARAYSRMYFSSGIFGR